MSSIGNSFLQTTADAADKRFQQKLAEDQKGKNEARQMYWKIAYDTRTPDQGGYTEAQRKDAAEKLDKLLPASLRKANQKFGQIYGTLSKAAQAHAATQPGVQPQTPAPQSGGSPAGLPSGPSTPAPGAPAASTTQPQTSAPQGAQPATPAPQSAQPQTQKPGLPTGPKTPVPQQAQGGVPIQTDTDQQSRMDAASKSENARKLDAEKQEYDTWLQRGKDVLGADASPRDLAEYAGSRGTKLPPVAAVKMTPVQLDMKDGQQIPAMRSPDGKYYDLHNNLLDGDAIKSEGAKASSGLPRFGGQDVTLDSAKAQAKGGQEFLGIDGKPIDLDSLPPNMVLNPISMNGKVLFLPVDPTQTHITVGNEVIATDKYHMKDIATGSGTDLGVARTGSTNTPTQVERDTQGVPHVVGSTTQPNTPGPKTAAPSQSSPTPAGAPSPRSGISNSQVPQTPAPGGGRQTAAVTPGMDKDYLQTARSVQQALTQVVGDESNPNLKTVVSLAPDILKDKTKTERVGKAIRMMLGGDNGLEGAHVSSGASIGPVSIGVGGFGEFLKQSLNMDAKVADKINQNLKTAMKDMTPEEKNLVDASISAFEESIAMRAINKSGVSNAQVGAIQNTLPLIGANTFSVDEFATRMQNWAQQGLNGTWGVPPQYFRKGFIDKLKSVSDDMEKLRGKGKPSPKTQKSLPGGPQTAAPGSGPKTADEYLKQLDQ